MTPTCTLEAVWEEEEEEDTYMYTQMGMGCPFLVAAWEGYLKTHIISMQHNSGLGIPLRELQESFNFLPSLMSCWRGGDRDVFSSLYDSELRVQC